MADVQVLAPGVKAAPLDYVIPGAQEILVKAIAADFDGSGAGGAFVPAVQIIAPGGKLAGTFIANGQVTAGDSVSVSWAPFLAGGGPNGVQFDTDPQAGGYLVVTTNDGNPLTDAGIELTTNNNHALDLQLNGGGSMDTFVRDGGAWVTIVDSGGLTLQEGGGGMTIQEIGGGLEIKETGGGGINMQATNGGTLTVSAFGGGQMGFNTFGTGTMILYSEDGIILDSHHTGGGEVSVPVRIYTGDVFAIEDGSNGNVFMFSVGSNGIDAYLKTSKSLTVHDHTGASILRVDESGPGYHIKTGKAWVADL